jgi:hypothetical protein
VQFQLSANGQPGLSPASTPGVDVWLPAGHLPTIIRELPGVPPLRWAKQYGGMALTFGFMQSGRVMVTDPVALKELLVRPARSDTHHCIYDNALLHSLHLPCSVLSAFQCRSTVS